MNLDWLAWGIELIAFVILIIGVWFAWKIYKNDKIDIGDLPLFIGILALTIGYGFKVFADLSLLISGATTLLWTDTVFAIFSVIGFALLVLGEYLISVTPFRASV